MANKENNTTEVDINSLAVSILNEEKIHSAEYFEYRENVSKFIGFLKDREEINDKVTILKEKLLSLEALEKQEDKTSKISSFISLGAISSAAIFASISQDMYPVGIISAIAVLVSAIGYSKKITLDNKEVILAKEIATLVTEVLNKEKNIRSKKQEK